MTTMSAARVGPNDPRSLTGDSLADHASGIHRAHESPIAIAVNPTAILPRGMHQL